MGCQSEREQQAPQRNLAEAMALRHSVTRLRDPGPLQQPISENPVKRTAANRKPAAALRDAGKTCRLCAMFGHRRRFSGSSAATARLHRCPPEVRFGFDAGRS